LLPAATRETKPWTLKGRWRLCLLGGARERGGGGSRLLARGARASLAPLAGHGLPPTGLVGYLLHRRALPRLLMILDADSPPDEDALDARVDSGRGARFEVAPALVRAGPARHAAAVAVAVRGEADAFVASLEAGLVALGPGNSIRATHDPCEVTCGARRILDGRIRSRRI
jgi:hypothetical protein